MRVHVFRLLAASLFVAGALALPGARAGANPPPIGISSSPTSVPAFMTLYGWADNSPPGTIIANPCLHAGAGGTGTYADPITFATDVSEVGWCVRIYVPYMHRYFIHEDECSECDANWSQSGLYRFDMWAGGDANSRSAPEHQALLRCESTWTRANSPTDPNNPTIIVNPPDNLPVTTAPIFSPPTSCWQPVSMTNPGRQTSVVSTAVSLQIHAMDTTAGQTLTYSALNLPLGLHIDSTSGLISGVPTTRQHARVTVSAADTYNSATVVVRWTVKPARRP
ncbi:MAG TPA: Ig domain-containing protein [Acidimicrobiales bacterium]|nr:Ig domain-containing protein [Acidimicrobiales bacterium]